MKKFRSTDTVNRSYEQEILKTEIAIVLFQDKLNFLDRLFDDNMTGLDILNQIRSYNSHLRKDEMNKINWIGFTSPVSQILFSWEFRTICQDMDEKTLGLLKTMNAFVYDNLMKKVSELKKVLIDSIEYKILQRKALELQMKGKASESFNENSEKIVRIKAHIIDLSKKVSRIMVKEIVEDLNQTDEDMVRNIIIEMISKNLIKARFYKGTDFLVFELESGSSPSYSI